MGHSLYQIFKTTLNISLKKHGKKTDNTSIRICINKTEYRTISRIKTGYYLELSMSEILKLFGSTKNKITKGWKWRKCTSFRHYGISISPL